MDAICTADVFMPSHRPYMYGITMHSIDLLWLQLLLLDLLCWKFLYSILSNSCQITFGKYFPNMFFFCSEQFWCRPNCLGPVIMFLPQCILPLCHSSCPNAGTDLCGWVSYKHLWTGFWLVLVSLKSPRMAWIHLYMCPLQLI